MNNDDFNELAGRIQGLGDFIMGLTMELEIHHVIDGERFTRHIQHLADNRRFDGEHLEATKRTLGELARFITDARRRRQEVKENKMNTSRRRHYR